MKSNDISIQGILFKFLFGTYCLTALMWGSIIVANQFGYLTYGTPLFMVLYIIGGCAPPIVAIVCLVKDKIMPAKQIFKTIFAVNQPVQMYFFTIVFAALYYIIPILLGAVTIISPPYIALVSLPVMMIGGGVEEVGWRFILQPSLEKKFPFFVATTITAIIWSLWHLPLFFIQGTNQFTTDFGSFVISVFGLAFALAAIYRLSNSLWLCILFHTIVNSVFESVRISYRIVPTFMTTVVLIVISLIVVLISNKSIAKKIYGQQYK